MSTNKVLLILLLKGCMYLQPLRLYAQPFNFTIYREADGLPSGYVQKAFEDSRGYLWLCTFGGLSRFDGRNFKNYDLKDGLPQNFSDAICEDKKGNLWIATRGGLCYFDGKHFTTYKNPPGIKGIYFSYLKVDKNNRFSCVIDWQNATAANGKIEFTDLLKDVRGLPEKKFVVNELADGSKIVNGINGIYKVSKQNVASLIFSTNGFNPYFYFHPGEQNAFYFFNDMGVYHWEDGKLENLSHLNFTNHVVTALFVDTQKKIWLGVEGQGVWIIDKNKTTLIAGDQLPGYVLVPNFYQDKEGAMWICTHRGLAKLTNKFATHFTNATGLDNQDIQSSRTLPDGSICMQTTVIKNGIPQLLPGNLSQQLAANKFEASVRAMETDGKNSWWIFNSDGNLCKWKNNALIKLPALDSSLRALGFFDTQTQTLWCGKQNEIVLVKDDKTIQTISSLANGSPLNRIYSLRKDYFGNIWLAERNRLLLNTKNGFIDFTPKLQLQKNVLADMACSNANGVWFKTQGLGAIHFSFTNNTFIKDKILNTDNGLPNNFINDIETDSRQNVWIATLGGLYRFTENRRQPGDYNIRSFTKADGIDVPNWNLAFLEKDTLNNMWLGVANGIFKINTSAIPETVAPPFVLIDEVTILNDDNAKDSTSTGFSVNNNGGDLDPGQNDLAFHFNGINLNNNYIRYAYTLNGRDKSWVTNQVNNEAIYYNLSPGNYSFRVKAVNDAGLESKIAVYNFVIEPPFWQRTWFRLVVALAASGIIYWFIKRRDAIKEKANLAALQMSELKLTALQSQMNPHFIFNSLNSIQNYILQQKPIDAAKYLSKFSKLMRRILDQSFYTLTPLNEIVETLKMYMELEAFRFSNEFSWQVKVENAESISDVKLPALLLQPYVENAIIHGLMPKEGEKKLLIHLYKKENDLHCVIDDNGVGRSNNLNETGGHISHGQKLTADMLDTMKQLLHTNTQIQITDKRDAENKPAGTTVDLIIPLTF